MEGALDGRLLLGMVNIKGMMLCILLKAKLGIGNLMGNALICIIAWSLAGGGGIFNIQRRLLVNRARNSAERLSTE